MSGRPPVSRGQLGEVDDAKPATPQIGDRLRQARERRGISIDSASAALKIRVPIIEAFEREDHNQLPPPVYALGQLRTYATYLGLDPNTVAAGWHTTQSPEELPINTSENAAASAANRFKALGPGLIRSTRGVLRMGGLGIAVLGISGFMTLQLLRFILPPSIAITYPVEAIRDLHVGVLSYEMKGTADAHASIVIETSAGAQLTTEADDSGLWTILVPLGTGRTDVVAHAVKPGTGGDSSATAERVFVVALPDTGPPDITVTKPAPNLVIANADVPVALVTAPRADIAITATDTSGVLISSSIRSDERGAATGGIALPSGRWTVSFSVTAPDGALGQATRTVDVSFTGITVSVTGGAASTWIRVWVDGVVDPAIGVTGKTVAPGARYIFTGSKRIEIRSGDPSILLVTLNGRTISELKSAMGAETYAFLSTGKVQKSSRR